MIDLTVNNFNYSNPSPGHHSSESYCKPNFKPYFLAARKILSQGEHVSSLEKQLSLKENSNSLSLFHYPPRPSMEWGLCSLHSVSIISDLRQMKLYPR